MAIWPWIFLIIHWFVITSLAIFKTQTLALHAGALNLKREDTFKTANSSNVLNLKMKRVGNLTAEDFALLIPDQVEGDQGKSRHWSTDACNEKRSNLQLGKE